MVFAVAVLFLRGRSNFRARRFGRIEAEWEPVIIAVIGGSGDPSTPEDMDEARHVLEIAGRFARRLRGPDRKRIEEFCASFVEVLRPDLSARSAERRAAAVELISVLALERYVDEIVNALDDKSPRVSLVAARALSNPDHPEFAAAVLGRLHRYTTWSSSLISSMLAQIGSGALEDLRRYLGDLGKPSAARAVVAGALRLLADPLSAELAADVLDTGDPELAVASLRLIGVVGGPAQADAVRKLIDHPVFFVRSATASVLGRIGDDSDVPFISAMVHDESPWVALGSAGALLKLGRRETLESLATGKGLASEAARETLFSGMAR
jgi:HEAT repeat protein